MVSTIFNIGPFSSCSPGGQPLYRAYGLAMSICMVVEGRICLVFIIPAISYLLVMGTLLAVEGMYLLVVDTSLVVEETKVRRAWLKFVHAFTWTVMLS